MPDLYPLFWPVIRRLDPERAHALALRLVRLWAPLAGGVPPADPLLRTRLWGLDFPNPVGLAAGFDKDAEVTGAMLRLGFGFVEAGTVTLRPQSGNPRPRLFRLPEDRAVINRFGFNNRGVDAAARRLARRDPRRGVVGINVGPNRDAADPSGDCARAVARLAPLADYLVVNVSSPNTPGLRSLQRRDRLVALLDRAREARDGAALHVPLLVKVAPDLTREERTDIAEVVLAARIDGLIATNTTIDRPPDLKGRDRGEAGGLSGAPLFARSTAVLADFYRLTQGRLPLIGTGGIASGADAYARIRAGASLVQLYTALVYEGPSLASRIGRDLALRLRRGGFASVADAVGADVRQSTPLTAGTVP